MNETKFTPGPWFAVNYAGHFDIQNTNDYGGLDLLDFDNIGQEQATANAALIAQAPAMYAAMQSFCTDFENDYVMEDGRIVDNPQNILVVNYNVFQFILAAARGESH